MAGYEQITIVGNLGRDPEMRFTQDGSAVTTFPVAVNRSWTRGNGEREEATTWFRVTAWRRQAETCAEYLSKGRQVMVTGRMNADRETGGPRLWTGQDGVTRASYEITAQNVVFLSGRSTSQEMDDAATEIDDEIPF